MIATVLLLIGLLFVISAYCVRKRLDFMAYSLAFSFIFLSTWVYIAVNNFTDHEVFWKFLNLIDESPLPVIIGLALLIITSLILTSFEKTEDNS